MATGSDPVTIRGKGKICLGNDENSIFSYKSNFKYFFLYLSLLFS